MKKSLLLLIILFSLNSLFSDERGLKIAIRNLDENNIIGRQYFVIIAINKYNEWMPLKNPVKDARELRDILKKRYYIQVYEELYDEKANKKNIIKLFKRLQNELQPEDSLLIFYAGHGHLDQASSTGAWIPVDSGKDVDLQENWIFNSQIRGYISNMKARHVCLISDSCFSGEILNINRAINLSIDNQYFKNAYKKISRQVLTSGASESVPDRSEFSMQIKMALEGNNQPYIDPLMLFNEVRSGVRQTTPMLGELRGTGHQEGASFLLFLRDKVEEKNIYIEEESLNKIVEEVEKKRIALLDEKISNLGYQINIMENKKNKMMKYKKPVIISANIFMGISTLSIVSSFACLGAQYYNVSLNQSATVSTDIEKYGNNAINLQGARNGLWISAGLSLIPSIILYIAYGYFKSYPKKIEKNKFKIRNYRKEKETLLSFDFNIYSDKICLGMKVSF